MIEAERCLDAAEADPSLDAAKHYARGLIALARSQTDSAVRELEAAIHRDPSVEVYYFKLGRAYQLAGRTKDSNQMLSSYREMEEQKRQQTLALDLIGQQPNRPELYKRAAALFERDGLPGQAAAIRAAAIQRFGKQP